MALNPWFHSWENFAILQPVKFNTNYTTVHFLDGNLDFLDHPRG